MENASKALIIAGAILLSILIIGLGVFIFNQAKKTVNVDSLTEQEISTFNSKFENYEGVQLGSTVRSMVNAVNSYNRTVNDGRYVTISNEAVATGKSKEFTATAAPTGDDYKASSYNSGASYTIGFDYTTGGLVSVIYIKQKTTN